MVVNKKPEIDALDASFGDDDDVLTLKNGNHNSIVVNVDSKPVKKNLRLFTFNMRVSDPNDDQDKLDYKINLWFNGDKVHDAYSKEELKKMLRSMGMGALIGECKSYSELATYLDTNLIPYKFKVLKYQNSKGYDKFKFVCKYLETNEQEN